MTDGLITDEHGVCRCWWCGEDDVLYQNYHDTEWGFPVTDDIRLFEKISLEGFQAGLSWITILRKRDNFRSAFAGFDFEAVARFSGGDIQCLLGDAGIVRHRGKIEAVINNARLALDMRSEYGSLAAYFWQFETAESDRPVCLDYEAICKMGQTDASKALSKDLKKRGWKFVGPTTCYAFMQAMGLVNDHIEGCAVREQVEGARKSFKRPC